MDYKNKYLKYKSKYLNLLNQKGNGVDEFHVNLLDNTRGIGLYALAAPNDCSSTNMKIENFNRIKKVVDECNPNGLIVYDVQDEPCRDGTKRPFPFFKKEQADIFANFLSKQFPNNPIILYRVLPQEATNIESTEEIRRNIILKWMDDTIKKRNQKTLVWIGGNSRKLPQINSKTPSNFIIDTINTQYKDVVCGNVCLPERGDIELSLMIDRTKNNCKFFITQIVYNFELYQKLINNYIDTCIEKKIEPSRIIFNFALFGEKKTLDFMKCLGVIFSEEVNTKILSEKTEETYITCSMEICVTMFKQLLQFRKDINTRFNTNVKFGFSVDVVTGNKAEYTKSIELYNLLNDAMKELY
jgi:5,10-methylenetetrahydrofolate reductase